MEQPIKLDNKRYLVSMMSFRLGNNPSIQHSALFPMATDAGDHDITT